MGQKLRLTDDQKAAYPAIYEELYQALLPAAEKKFDALAKTQTKLAEYSEKQRNAAVGRMIAGTIRVVEGMEAPEINPKLQKIFKDENKERVLPYFTAVIQVQAAIGMAPGGKRQINDTTADQLILDFAKHLNDHGITAVMAATGKPIGVHTERAGGPTVQRSGVTRQV